MIVRPMLAASLESGSGESVPLSKLKYPLLASIKYDGVRALKVNDTVLSRSFKPIPNTFVQRRLASLPNGLDGELVVAGQDFSGTSSGVMSKDGEPDFVYYIFDYVKDSLDKPFQDRLHDLLELKEKHHLPECCILVEHKLVSSHEELE